MGIKKKQDEKLVIHKPPHGGKIEFEQPYDFNIIKIGQTSEPPMTLRELNKKVDKIETTVSELAKIVTEFIVRQEQFNEEQRQFNARQEQFNAYVLDVFSRNNLK